MLQIQLVVKEADLNPGPASIVVSSNYNCFNTAPFELIDSKIEAFFGKLSHP